MKIVFIGSKEIGLACLEELIALNQEIALIISTKEEKELQKLAKHKKISYLAPENIDKLQGKIEKIKPDLMIICGWSRLLGENIFSIPQKGTVALHGSLLPKNRGFAPMTWPIINNEKKTGMTLFYLNEEMDQGDIVAQEQYAIGPTDTGQDLYLKAIQAVRHLTSKYIPLIEKGSAPRVAQKESEATYAFARVPEDGLIDWTKSALEIYNLIRALTKPFPGAFTYYKNKKLFIWSAKVLAQNLKFSGNCGQVVKIMKGGGVWVLTGKGIIILETVQIEGEKEVASGDLFKSIKTKLGYDIIKELTEIKKLPKGKRHAGL